MVGSQFYLTPLLDLMETLPQIGAKTAPTKWSNFHASLASALHPRGKRKLKLSNTSIFYLQNPLLVRFQVQSTSLLRTFTLPLNSLFLGYIIFDEASRQHKAKAVP